MLSVLRLEMVSRMSVECGSSAYEKRSDSTCGEFKHPNVRGEEMNVRGCVMRSADRLQPHPNEAR